MTLGKLIGCGPEQDTFINDVHAIVEEWMSEEPLRLGAPFALPGDSGSIYCLQLDDGNWTLIAIHKASSEEDSGRRVSVGSSLKDALEHFKKLYKHFSKQNADIKFLFPRHEQSDNPKSPMFCLHTKYVDRNIQSNNDAVAEATADVSTKMLSSPTFCFLYGALFFACTTC
eukprot:m.767065 g.767065  ORF g.767065 m.767065 type:complete len:171 (+) comp23226_c0_seq3:1546-2058(+)